MLLYVVSCGPSPGRPDPPRDCWNKGEPSQPKETSPSVRSPSGWAAGTEPSENSRCLSLAWECRDQDFRLCSPSCQKSSGLSVP